MIADVDGKVPLVEALIARDPATVKLLWENGATLQNADKGQLLGQAVQDNNVDLIEDFLLYGASIDESDEEGLTPLHVAVLHGQVSMAKYLLSKGANPNHASDSNIATPLQLAEQNLGNPDFAKLLRSSNEGSVREELKDSIHPAIPHGIGSDISKDAVTSSLPRLKKTHSVEFQMFPPASPVRPKRPALGRRQLAINTLMQKQSTRGRRTGSLSHKALQQLNINPWGRRKSGNDSIVRSQSMDPQGRSAASKRVTIHPYHPQSREGLSASGVAKLITLPGSIAKILEVASTCL